MSKKMRKMAVLAKMEVTYGVDPTPTGAANAMVVSDVELTPLEGEEAEVNTVQPHFGHTSTVQATSYGKVRFKVPMAASGVAGTAPGYSPLLRACSVSVTVSVGVSVTFAPVSDNQESVTIYGNIDGVNHIMRGVRGEAKATMDAKGVPWWELEFTGLFTPLADTLLPTAVYTNFTQPVAMNKANTTCSVHGVTVAASHFDLALGNQVVKRDLTEVDSVEITDRKSAGSLVFEATAIATKDWVATAKAKTRGNLSLVHGTTAGNIITFTATNTLELGKPTYSNQDGVQMINLPTRYIPTAAGNDEWSIVMT